MKPEKFDLRAWFGLIGPILGSVILVIGGYVSAREVLSAEFRGQQIRFSYTRYVEALSDAIFFFEYGYPSNSERLEEREAEFEHATLRRLHSAENILAISGSKAVIEATSKVREILSSDPSVDAVCKALSPVFLEMRSGVADNDEPPSISAMQILAFGGQCDTGRSRTKTYPAMMLRPLSRVTFGDDLKVS